MSLNTQVLEILQVSENAYADDALVEGLARTDPACHQAIVDVVLGRNGTTGLVGLITHYHQLDTKLQNRVREQSDQLFGVLRRCVKARETQTRHNAIDLVGRIGSYRSAYLLPLALHDRSADIRQRAAEILRELADRYFRQERITLEVLASEPADEGEQFTVQAYSLARLAEERSYLVSAIDEAVNGYEVHRRAEVAETVVWFAEHLSDTLWRAIASRLSSCGRAIAELIQTATDPRIVPFVYQAFTHQDLRAAAIRVVSEQRNEAFMREFVARDRGNPDSGLAGPERTGHPSAGTRALLAGRRAGPGHRGGGRTKGGRLSRPAAVGPARGPTHGPVGAGRHRQ
jgi:hypothetical protein